MDGVTGLFVALVVSVMAGEAFIRLCSRKKMMNLLSDDPNTAVPQSFVSVLPAGIVLFSAAAFRMLLVWGGLGAPVSDLVNNMLRAPFQNSGDGVGTGIVYNFFTHIMWLFGIHGNNVLDGVAQSVLVPALHENAAALAAGASR